MLGNVRLVNHSFNHIRIIPDNPSECNEIEKGHTIRRAPLWLMTCEPDYLGRAGWAGAVMTEVADLMMPAISARSAGIIMVLLALASLPNSPRYCSATRRLTALMPPGSLIALAIARIPSEVALYGSRRRGPRPR